MNINLGLYDVFANALPGMIYLVLLYELLGVLKLKIPDISNIFGISFVVILFIVAFILGHIFIPLSYYGWYPIFDNHHIKSPKLALH
jgi:hypothetical protein